MIGLIIKDLLNLKKQCKILLLIIAVYMIVGFTSGDMSMFMAMISLLIVMLPITALAYDERAKFEKYALTMPISRNDLVKSKYYLGLIMAMIALILQFIINIIGYYTVGTEISRDSIFFTVILFGVSLLFMSIMLPFNFKFGVEKGRYFIIIVALVPTFIVFLSKKLFPGMQSDIQYFMEKISQMEISKTIIYILIINAIIYFISMFISMAIYSKKEY